MACLARAASASAVLIRHTVEVKLTRVGRERHEREHEWAVKCHLVG